MLCVPILASLLLAACGEEDPDREFAPEIRDGQAIESPTPFPTSTSQPLNRQPGESDTGTDAAGLIDQEGPVNSISYGLTEISVLDVASGDTTATGIVREPASLVALSPDGSTHAAIIRSEGKIEVTARNASGEELARWPVPIDATPEATPEMTQPIQVGDRLSWNAQSTHFIVSIAGVGVFTGTHELEMTAVGSGQVGIVTAVAWSPAGQSIALATWDGDHKAAVIRTASLRDLDALTTVLELGEGDGRFVRSLAWGNERVGLVFALRSLDAGFSRPSDLFYLPGFGQPMRLLATAGVAAPAAVVDQIAIAGNGSVVAYTVLVPGEVGLRYHSLWITDASAPGSVRIETAGIRRATEIAWTGRGLVLSGTRRESSGEGLFQVAVVELVTPDGLSALGEIRSAATPVGSPEASPAAATPAT